MSGPPSLVRRLVRWALLLGVPVLIIAVVLLTPRLFLWPPSDQPTKADAVVGLGGDPGQVRAHYAIELARSGDAPIAVISLGGKKSVPCPHRVVGVTIICFRADPLNTRGEAEYVATLAAQRRWHRIIVVSERTQTTRARVLFKRCTAVQLVMAPVADPRSHLLYDVTYEWGALLKALVWQRSC